MLSPDSYQNMFDNSRPVVIAGSEGNVIAQNKSAKRLLGSGTGKYCWDLMGSLENTDNLPCREGCVVKLLSVGKDYTLNAEIKLGGQRNQLSCVPVSGMVVCTLSHVGNDAPKAWQILSPREQDILTLLAEGQTTSSVAAHLGLSQSTVRTHVERMRSKLNVATRAAIVAEGFRLGYLD
ncbi:MAG: LuxR C-terminal-related transcriptional regulator [Gammaproteobacteria bacterium]|nr:LuxR C-terminal-related transcriptional regulator [Gammaproteobacteria bacterium]